MGRTFTELSKFEWDDAKRQSNISKHGIDFADASNALRMPHLEFESARNGEIRTLAICPERLKLIAIVYIMRGEACRLISARNASKHEQRAYRQVYG